MELRGRMGGWRERGTGWLGDDRSSLSIIHVLGECGCTLQYGSYTDRRENHYAQHDPPSGSMLPMFYRLGLSEAVFSML